MIIFHIIFFGILILLFDILLFLFCNLSNRCHNNQTNEIIAQAARIKAAPAWESQLKGSVTWQPCTCYVTSDITFIAWHAILNAPHWHTSEASQRPTWTDGSHHQEATMRLSGDFYYIHISNTGELRICKCHTRTRPSAGKHKNPFQSIICLNG